jgi:hypothetical protein
VLAAAREAGKTLHDARLETSRHFARRLGVQID